MIDPSTDIPNKGSSADEWIQWMTDLVSAVGVKDAKPRFITAWKYRGSSSANTNVLRTFLKSNYGITIDESIFDSVVDAGDSVMDTIGGVFNFGKYTTYAVIGIIVITGGIALYNIAMSSVSIAKTGIGAAAGAKGGMSA